VVNESVAPSRAKLRLVAAGWWGLIPSLLLLGVFVLYPLIQVFQISSLKWDGVVAGESIGFNNYAQLFRDPDLGCSLLTTLIFAALTLPAFVALAAITAIELEGSRLERIVKAALFLPGLWTIGASAIGWYTLYSPDYGVVTTLTASIVNPIAESLDRLSESTSSLPVLPSVIHFLADLITLRWGDNGAVALLFIAAFTIWQHIGYAVLVVSAGLKGIPQETLEAARVDGASESQVRWRIVVPLLRPSLIFLGVIGSLYALQSYTAVFLLTKGGPFGSTRVLGYFLYETAFEKFEFGYGAALSVLVLAVAFTFATLQARALRSE
jgi:multiple sugar transport system permease protein